MYIYIYIYIYIYVQKAPMYRHMYSCTAQIKVAIMLSRYSVLSIEFQCCYTEYIIYNHLHKTDTYIPACTERTHGSHSRAGCICAVVTHVYEADTLYVQKAPMYGHVFVHRTDKGCHHAFTL